ncbi:MAG TPA: VCBS repeat-containing protein [Chitinophagaceae bacterium]|nr:VCBS repeat-containing protein [Chitinophagaceae bacterium]
MLPDPSLLDTKNWENGVLPAMGPRLGIFNYGLKEYPSSRHDMDLDKNFYPSQPVLKLEDWQHIIDYYTSVSPDSLPAQQRKYAVKKEESLFRVEIPLLKKTLPTTCLLKIDTSVFPYQLMVADMMSKNIFRFDNHLLLLDSFKSVSPVVDMEIHPHEIITCNIGIMNPNNGKYGNGRSISIDKNGKMQADSTLKLDKLARPVQLTSADFNRDGKTDYLVCEYGNLTGSLSWMENLGSNKYERHVLRNVPGPIKAYIRDVNHDGLPDIWVLFAQGDEGIFLFTNKGQGIFEQEEVLRFQPIFGSSYFELADFNNDGYPDIVYTCGDNADYSPTLKPYHGVYIFINDGNNHFKQKYFFPMYGCFKAIARDFDGDGDLDIAAISFFADYTNHPEESFIYLENKGWLDFQPYSIPNTSSGRWLTMDAADLDGDGKIDLVLGNFAIAPTSIKAAINWKDGPAFIVLKNIIKK